jgi:hypothetical protein
MKQLFAPEAAEQVEYRSVSGLAVLTLVLGGLSVAALASPAAWVIPLPAIVCGLWALHRIRRRPDELLGRKAAWVGLGLALFFGSWAPSRYYCDRWLLHGQAREFALEWFQIVFRNDLELAHQATLNFYLRQPEGTLLQEFYQDHPEDLQELQTYFSQGVAADLVQLGRAGRARFDRNVELYFEDDSCHITQRFWIMRAGQDTPVVHAQVRVVRNEHRGNVYWSMLGLADAQRMDELTSSPE